MMVKVDAMFSHGRLLHMAELYIAIVPFDPGFNRTAIVSNVNCSTLIEDAIYAQYL
jgi:hypothetical protein